MRRLLAVTAISLSLAASALAAENGKISVELNDLQQADTGCRSVFVLKNDLGKPLDKVTFRVVAFDGEGKAKLFLSLDAGALPTAKTRILRFDLGDKVACTAVSRIVLDDVTACSGAGIEPGACLAALSLSSRASIPFDF